MSNPKNNESLLMTQSEGVVENTEFDALGLSTNAGLEPLLGLSLEQEIAMKTSTLFNEEVQDKSLADIFWPGVDVREPELGDIIGLGSTGTSSPLESQARADDDFMSSFLAQSTAGIVFH